MRSNINRSTGKHISYVGHLHQSINDILTTPIGSRVMRRDYGSRLYRLVDAPMNQATFVEIYTATAEALRLWEPRLNLTRVQVEQAQPGKIALSLEGEIVGQGKVTLNNVLI